MTPAKATTTPEKIGLLLINVGSPAHPTVPDVRAYLNQFLSDPRVIDIAGWKRAALLRLIILPTRPRRSARAYRSIWTDEGSPLVAHSVRLADKVQALLGPAAVVTLGMRYGAPSLANALAQLAQAQVRRVVVFPLYPQAASATTGSALAEVFRSAAAQWDVPLLHVVPPFYDHPAYLAAVCAQARPLLATADAERILFSFHGLPVRQIKRSDASGAHCLCRPDCCDDLGEANHTCYRAQCFATARALTRGLQIPEDQAIVCFQSRLGRTPWIAPHTDQVLAELRQADIRRVAILSPSFVADCLETLEELGIRARQAWLARGGEAFTLLPCLNDSDAWAQAVVAITRATPPTLTV